jgi:hypothetical protein
MGTAHKIQNKKLYQCDPQLSKQSVSTTFIRVPSFDSANNALGTSLNQVGKWGFFKNALSRGSLCEFFSAGNKLIAARSASG